MRNPPMCGKRISQNYWPLNEIVRPREVGEFDAHQNDRQSTKTYLVRIRTANAKSNLQ
jgi:hypothetical protein